MLIIKEYYYRIMKYQENNTNIDVIINKMKFLIKYIINIYN